MSTRAPLRSLSSSDKTSNGKDPLTSSAASTGAMPRTRARRGRLPSGERVDEDPRRIDAVVMILEDVLYDHTNMLAHFAIDRAIQQLIKEAAFPNTVAAYEALQSFRHAFGYRKRFPRFVDSLIAQQRLSYDAAERVTHAYYESQINEARTIKPFERARATLEKLRDAGYRMGLVCVGKDNVQMERLRTIGLQDFFTEIVFVPSNPSVNRLSQAMKEIGRRLMLQPSSILFVGRKVFYEIKAANKVGLVTVRMLHGKYGSVMPIEELEQPDYQIGSIDQLSAIVRLADQQMIKPKIVAIGGGTGLAVLLKELRHYPADLTAIVTVFDSGRHSGALRKYLGILPPGDIRNCLVALSDSDEVMNKLMNYRFKENFMEGCSLGNLLLAALTDIQGGFDKAVTSVSDILNIHGNVLPATLDSTELCAELEDGSVVVSEVHVRSPDIVDENGTEHRKPPIKRVFLEKENVDAFLPAVRAIENADIILLSPGGFYTSIISTLLVPGIRDAIRRSTGATVYISNVATQCGQTDGLTLEDTLDVLYQYLGDNSIDYVIANNAEPSEEVMKSYFSRGETLLLPTPDMLNRSHPIVLQGKTFEDIEDGSLAVKKEWNKATMIKHSGRMVAAMLYRIIEQEIEDMRAKMMLGGHFRHQSPAHRDSFGAITTQAPASLRKRSSQRDRANSTEASSKSPPLAASNRTSMLVAGLLLAIVSFSSAWRPRQ
ncbi:hypothetical protein Poli38472_006553 [Pythium oligandrum]|uniref:Gluconeogenesis factor n=1 Tax=Pythium oligandrum TaxID=41045 RepID=A0A8K1C593_PYTOL|nr:hypothetical protein Poli38472_006553 [Pythium oligandrum]|eukprot:TMW56543.1 hypothetical protein Poli38472_006553 [Pythium oligandrum]